jgi:uncharacterized protein with HEPN domain
MNKDPIVFLEHILDCIEKINCYTHNLDLEAFLNNNLIQDGVIRNLEIIGEATKNLPKEFKAKYHQIEWKKIAGLRDKLIHNYMGVDLWAVWSLIENRIPILETEILFIFEKEKKLRK